MQIHIVLWECKYKSPLATRARWCGAVPWVAVAKKKRLQTSVLASSLLGSIRKQWQGRGRVQRWHPPAYITSKYLCRPPVVCQKWSLRLRLRLQDKQIGLFHRKTGVVSVCYPCSALGVPTVNSSVRYRITVLLAFTARLIRGVSWEVPTKTEAPNVCKSSPLKILALCSLAEGRAYRCRLQKERKKWWHLLARIRQRAWRCCLPVTRPLDVCYISLPLRPTLQL